MMDKLKAVLGVLAVVAVIAGVLAFRARTMHCASVKECADALPDLGEERTVVVAGAVEAGDEGAVAETVARGDVEYQRFFVRDETGRIALWHHGPAPAIGAKISARATVFQVIGPTSLGGPNVKRNVLLFERVEP